MASPETAPRRRFALDRDAEITMISDQVHSFYSACALPSYLAGDLNKRGLFVKTRKDYQKDKIKLLFGQSVKALDVVAKKVVLDDKALGYDKLILATGSRPLVPPIDGAKLPGVHTFKYLDDAVGIARGIPEIRGSGG